MPQRFRPGNHLAVIDRRRFHIAQCLAVHAEAMGGPEHGLINVLRLVGGLEAEVREHVIECQTDPCAAVTTGQVIRYVELDRCLGGDPYLREPALWHPAFQA